MNLYTKRTANHHCQLLSYLTGFLPTLSCEALTLGDDMRVEGLHCRYTFSAEEAPLLETIRRRLSNWGIQHHCWVVATNSAGNTLVITIGEGQFPLINAAAEDLKQHFPIYYTPVTFEALYLEAERSLLPRLPRALFTPGRPNRDSSDNSKITILQRNARSRAVPISTNLAKGKGLMEQKPEPASEVINDSSDDEDYSPQTRYSRRIRMVK